MALTSFSCLCHVYQTQRKQVLLSMPWLSSVLQSGRAFFITQLADRYSAVGSNTVDKLWKFI